MKVTILGLPLFIFFVLTPMWANLLANIAMKTDLEPKSRITLLLRAHTSDPCNMKILQSLGDRSVEYRFFAMAAWAYEKATICAPEQAVYHFTLGETMVAMNQDGIPQIQKAIELEPNNPIFKQEYLRITTHLAQQPSQ